MAKIYGKAPPYANKETYITERASVEEANSFAHNLAACGYKDLRVTDEEFKAVPLPEFAEPVAVEKLKATPESVEDDSRHNVA